MLKGFCPKCGNQVLGWALLDSRFQHCDLWHAKYLIPKNESSTRAVFSLANLEQQSAGYSIAVQERPRNR